MNDKSCLLDATVHILNIGSFRNPNFPEGYNEKAQEITRQILIERIGHDGSERGFHSQELTDALRKDDILLIRHELFPCLQLPPVATEEGYKRNIIPIYSRDEAPGIFEEKLRYNHGLLVCRSPSGVHHALSYQAGSNTAYDVYRDKFIPLEHLDVVMFLEFYEQ